MVLKKKDIIFNFKKGSFVGPPCIRSSRYLPKYLPRYVRLYKICRYLAFKMFVCRFAARITVSRSRLLGSKDTHVLSHKKNIVFP